MPQRLRVLVVVVSLFWAALASAQVTTGTIRGTVTSADDHTPMMAVSVTLLHIPTGTTKSTVTNDDGEYVFTNLRVGGPYKITAQLEGFKDTEEDGIFLTAGKTRDTPLELHLSSEVIEVAGTTVQPNTSSKTVITAQDIDSMPSISRDPHDLVRRAPDVSVEGSSKTMSVQGMNPRFNSITVDGIREDDDFGLSSNGYPTLQSPIALSAIEEMVLETAPFDVRYGKFMGGNVNIITKSGENDFHGELFGTYTSNALSGNRTDNQVSSSPFHEYRYGGFISGPIVKDKVHFFLDVEGLDSITPVSVGPAGSSAVNVVNGVTSDEVAMAQQIAQSVYRFNAGVPSQNNYSTDLKIFAKADWEISSKQRLTVTYQRTGDSATEDGSYTQLNLPLTSNWYNAVDTLNTVSARLYSDWTDHLSTEVEADGKLVSNGVAPLEGNGFMEAEIRTPEGGEIILGPNPNDQSNSLADDLAHMRFSANYLSGKHLITVGVEEELLHIDNLFISGTDGVAVYPTLAAFEAQQPMQISYTNATTLNPADGAADWNSGILTAYAQDQYQVTSQLTVTGGLRLETYQANQDISPNANFYDRYGFWNTATLNGRSILMPRVGASYMPIDNLNLRGGAGLYSGGDPTVWVSNTYTNDGVRVASAFSSDPTVVNGFDGRTIPTALSSMIQAGNGNVDVLDPNFQLPSSWKIGGGADYSFDIPQLGDEGKNFGVKVNYTHTRVHEGVNWIDMRRDLSSLPDNVPIGTTVDGRPLYDTTNFNVNRGYDMLLTNDPRGYGDSASIVLEKSFPFGLYLGGTYAYENVMEVNPANSSRSVSNYSLYAIDNPNDPGETLSNYDRKNRLTGSVEFSHAFYRNYRTSIGLFAETRSGQPFSWVFADANFGTTLGKIFGESSTFAANDHELFYVPKSGDTDVELQGMTQAQFDEFLKETGLDKYRGQIAPRNAFSSPWVSRIDMRFAQEIPNPLGRHARFMLDIQNLGNLLDNRWGRDTSAPFPYMVPAVNVAYDAANNKYIYSMLRNPNQNVVSFADSIWKISVGLSIDF
ncbi:MAG TPA: TonB-dependent receptor [Gemmatimonadaceae bacterium]|jgi:outer membrane receptor for ferrienterochelin and colicin|nr:TonB-dependent receptor [Gemmatimonadaceae bacterium]